MAKNNALEKAIKKKQKEANDLLKQREEEQKEREKEAQEKAKLAAQQQAQAEGLNNFRQGIEQLNKLKADYLAKAQELAAKKQFQDAVFYVNMAKMITKVSSFAEKYVARFELITTASNMLKTISESTKMLNNVMKTITSGGTMKAITKSIKKMGKVMAKLDKDMDRLNKEMTASFSPNKKKKGEEINYEEMYNNEIGSMDTGDVGGAAPTVSGPTTTTTTTGGGTGSTGDFGAL